MIVRTMDIHEPFSEGGQHLQSCRRAIDELFVGACGRKSSFQNELVVLARFNSILVEKAWKRRRQSGGVEDRFDRTALRSAANQGPVGALAQHKIERADDDRFAGAGLATDG